MKSKLRMRLEIKEISEQGTFEGLLSPYGIVDGGGDVIIPGAYAKTLKDQGPTRPMLWQHKTDMPIGELTLDDQPDGLHCKGQLLMSLPEAQKAYLLIKARIVKGLSIGFESVKDAIENGVRNLKEIRLYEGSIVTFPMAESAMITSVKNKGKGETKDDFNDTLTDLQLQDAGYQMRTALAQALSSLFWSGLSKEDIVTATEVVIQQFSDAYMAYVPAYIDCLTEMYGGMETYAAKRLEIKAGAMISAANKTKIQTAVDHVNSASEHTKAANDIMTALIADEAADDTDTSKAKAAAVKPEPVPDHSAAQQLLTELKSLFKAA